MEKAYPQEGPRERNKSNNARVSTKRKRKPESTTEDEEDEESDELSTGPTRISRIITACRRCRTKKIKCDKKLPRCSNCVKAGVDECLSLDGTGKVVSRSYVLELEEKVKALTNRIEEIENRGEPVNNPGGFDLSKTLLLTDDFMTKVRETDDDTLPKKEFAESCLISYFQYSNVQNPIIHAPYYLNTYFKPLYGSLNVELWYERFNRNENLQIQGRETGAEADEISEDLRSRCLFFLYAIIAIATSSDQQKYPLSVSEMYRIKSLKYIDSIWKQKNEVAMDLGKLEMLQSLLLLSQYALMRPSDPSALYLVGTSARLCFDLELHKESPEYEVKKYGYQDISFITEMKRRLLWSCFCLDRQTSLSLDKPYSMDINQIDMRFPSLLDDSQTIPGWLQNDPALVNITQKQVSLHFIKLRILQGEIYSFINDKNNKIEVDRNSDGDVVTDASNVKDISATINRIQKWRLIKHNRLNDWYQSRPDSIGNNEFIQIIFELNYHRSLLLLYSVSAINPSISNAAHFEILYNSGRHTIIMYFKLHRNLQVLNFSWMTTKGLFLGASSYLYSIHNCAKIRENLDLDDFNIKIQVSLSIMEELNSIAHIPTSTYQEKLKTLSAGVLKRYEKETNHTRSMNMPATISGLDPPNPVDKFPSSVSSSIITDNNLYDSESVLTSVNDTDNHNVHHYINNSTNLSNYYSQPVYSPNNNESVLNLHMTPIDTPTSEHVGPLSAPISGSIAPSDPNSYFSRESLDGDDVSSRDYDSNYHFRY